MIDTLLIDLDNTILDFNKAEGPALAGALRTMGISPVGFLVLPRMFALMFMLPLLCVYADIMGILGGFIVGVFMLKINPIQYLTHTWQSVPLVNFWIGLVHSTVFGVLVAMAGCYRGMRCGKSALGVGQATTAAVVTSILAIIIAVFSAIQFKFAGEKN